MIFKESNGFKLPAIAACRSDNPKVFEPVFNPSSGMYRTKLFAYLDHHRLWLSPPKHAGPLRAAFLLICRKALLNHWGSESLMMSPKCVAAMYRL
ncbi:MAG TPA: hypothetical protein VIT23_07450 [Terrimicrobiaceae bacterium]